MEPDAVVDQIRAGGLLRRGAPVVVLLSGGRDSVCLLDVATRIAGAACVGAVHVDYGLRDEAAADADHCRALCAELGVALTVEQAMPHEGGNVQAWARELATRPRRAPPRGAGRRPRSPSATPPTTRSRRSSTGSPPRRADGHCWGCAPVDGAIVRPLLELTRAETTAYCEARGLAWRDDVTNAGRRYARNRIRHDLVAALREVHPAAEANVLRLAAVLGEEAELLDGLVDEQLDRPTAGGPTIPLARLRALAPALQRLIVQRLADAAAGRPVAGAAGHAEAVAALSARGTAYAELGRRRARGRRVRRRARGGGRARGAGRGAARPPRPPAPAAVELPIPGAGRLRRLAGRLRGERAGAARRRARPRRARRRPAAGAAAGAAATGSRRSASAAARRCRTSSPPAGSRARARRAAGRAGRRRRSHGCPASRPPARFSVTARTREAVRLSATPAS